MRKRILSICLVVLILVSSLAFADRPSTEIIVEGRYADAKGTIVDNRTLVPVRELFNILGIDDDNIVWSQKDKTVDIDYGDQKISLKLGQDYAYVDSKKVELDIAARLIGNKTMVPLRFIGESLGKEVDFKKNTVLIDTDKSIVDDPKSQESFKGNYPKIGICLENKLLDLEGIVVNNRTLLPLRDLLNILGIDDDAIVWNNSRRAVEIRLDNKNIFLQINKNMAYINGREVALDSPAILLNSKTMVPLRFIAEAMGRDVGYENNRVLIDCFEEDLDQTYGAAEILNLDNKAYGKSLDYRNKIRVNSAGNLEKDLGNSRERAFLTDGEKLYAYVEGDSLLEYDRDFKQKGQHTIYRKDGLDSQSKDIGLDNILVDRNKIYSILKIAGEKKILIGSMDMERGVFKDLGQLNYKESEASVNNFYRLDESLYFTLESIDGFDLYGLDLRTGKISKIYGSKIAESPVFTAGKLYFIKEQATRSSLESIDLRSGQLDQHASYKESIRLFPGDKSLYFTTTDYRASKIEAKLYSIDYTGLRKLKSLDKDYINILELNNSLIGLRDNEEQTKMFIDRL